MAPHFPRPTFHLKPMCKPSLKPVPLIAALLAIFPVINSTLSRAADLPDTALQSAAAPSNSSQLPDLGQPVQKDAAHLNLGPGGISFDGTFDRQKILLTPEFSNETGVSIGVTLASMLGEDAAVGVLLNAGSDKREVLLNAGFKMDERQRFVLTVGQLKQYLDYNFVSGKEKVGLAQNSGGLSYQIQLGSEFLRFLEVNGYIAKTAGRDLADKTFVVDSATLLELWNDPRRIAGGTVAGYQGRLGFSLIEGSFVKVSLGQERLTYDLLNGHERTNRLTSGVEWLQQLPNHFQLKFSADVFASQNRYSIGLDRSISAADGGRHGLGASIVRIQGRDGLGHDTQVKLNYTYAFGTGNRGAGGQRALAMPSASDPRLDAARPSARGLSSGGPTAAGVGSSLLDQVVQRPSYVPSHIVAKIDTTALPTRLIAVDKSSLPTGTALDATSGDITVPLGVVVTGIAGITRNLVAFANSGQFVLSGNNLIVRPSQITQPAVGVIDAYVVTIDNQGGGTTLATVVVSHGSIKIDSITVTTIAPDTTPDAFSFVDTTGVALSTSIESAAITVAGINAAAPISVSGGEYSINGGAWTTANGTVSNGQSVKVRHTSSASNSTATNTVLTIGGISDTFTSTTLAAVADTTPPSTPTSLALTGNVEASAGYTRTQAIAMNVADVTDPSGVMWFVTESSSAPAASDAGWSSTKPTSFTLSAGDGTKNVYVFVKDNATPTNNVQALGKLATIVLDTGMPTITSLPSWTGGVTSSSTTATSVTFGDTAGGTPKAVSITVDNGASITGFTGAYGARGFNLVAPVDTSGNPITVTITYSVTDNAGNVTTTTQGVSVESALPPGYIQQGGLTWMPNTLGPWSDVLSWGFPGYTDWNTANTYCTTSTINGRTGWRLPSKDELVSLHTSGELAGKPDWTLSYAWSSTFDRGDHYIVDLNNGQVTPAVDWGNSNVSCVR